MTPLLRPATPGRALASGLRARLEAESGRNLARVRVHDDLAARSAVDAVDASAATHGWHVYWGSDAPDPSTPRGARLLRHELAHAGDDPGHAADRPLVSRRSDPHERAAAEASRGHWRRPFPQPNHRAPLIHRGDKQATSSNDVQEIRHALDYAPGPPGADAALSLLGDYVLTDAIQILVQLDSDASGRIERIGGALRVGDTSPLAGAIAAVLLMSTNQRATASWAVVAGHILAGLPPGDRLSMLETVLRVSGRAAEIPALREGMAVLEESAAALAATPERVVDDPAAAAVPPTMGGVTPAPWAPGRQPVPFYLGNAAHVGIAAAYAAVHPTDVAFYNTVSVATLVAAAERLGLTLGTRTATASQLAMQPDIANLTRLHLYEIKPTSLRALGASEAALYVAAFAAAGLAVSLGSSSEPGTSGVIPAPGGWYEFSAPQAGVITYNYRQPPRVRVRAPAPAPQPQTRPLSEPEATGVVGTALMILLLILSRGRIRGPVPVRGPVPI